MTRSARAAPAAPPRWRALLPYAGVFALALGVRLLYLWSWHDTALFTTPVGDARAYLEWAQQIAAGDWLGREVFYQAPLYPYFLGALHALFGAGPWTARLAQAVLGSGACVALALAGMRFFSRPAGWAAGLGLALYPPAIWFDGLIQKASLDGLLMCLLLLALALWVDRDRLPLAFVAGALLGLLALTRENALALAPVTSVFALLGGPPRPRLRRVLALGALALGLALPLLPVGARNQMLGGRFLVTTSQLGPNLWIGNHPGASGRYEPLRPGHGDARFERDDARELAEQAAGHSLSPAEVSDYWRDRALAFVRDHPREWLALLAHKWALVWNAQEVPDTEGMGAYAEASRLLGALNALFGFGTVACLALVGVVATAAGWRRLWVLWAYAAVLAASVAFFYVFARYRYSLVPVLLLLAAAGATQAVAAARAREARRVLTLAAAAGLAALFVRQNLMGTADVALTHYSVGAELLAQGHAREALPELQRAVDALPNFPLARIRLADALRETGDPTRALALCDAEAARSPDLAEVQVSRGLALWALGRLDDARLAFERALALDPRHADAHGDLGNLLLAQKRAGEALPHYRAALAERPNDANFETNLGAGLLQADQPAEALVHFERALTLAPGHPTARLDRALALDMLGRADEALAAYRTVLAAEAPDSPRARMARAGVERLTAAR